MNLTDFLGFDKFAVCSFDKIAVCSFISNNQAYFAQTLKHHVPNSASH